MTVFAKSSTLCLLSASILLTLTAGNLSAGTLFKPVQTEDSGGIYAYSVAVADVNGDGKPDLVVANCCGGVGYSGAVDVLLGNGDGTFRPPVSYSGVYQPIAVVIADVNGDGKLDVVVANNCESNDCNAGSVGVLLGNGDGTFQSPLTFASGGLQPTSVAVVDLNGDSKPDVVVVNACQSSGCPDKNGVVGVLLGNGNGNFQAVQTYASGGLLGLSVAAGDVNGDGKPDVVVGNSNGASVLLGRGDGTLAPAVLYASGTSYARSVTLADVNGDNIPDLLVASDDGTVGILFGNGDGTFQHVALYSSGGFGAASVAFVDVNGDGKPDLLVATSCLTKRKCDVTGGSLNILPGNGNGTFKQIQRYSLGKLPAKSMAVADLTGTGKLDAVVAGCPLTPTCGEGAVGILLGNSPVYTSTSLSSSPNPSSYGQTVTLTATVTSAAPGEATGTVTFKNGTKTVGTATLNTGVATLKTKKLPVGTLSLTAAYHGDSNSAKSTSPVLIQVVNAGAH